MLKFILSLSLLAVACAASAKLPAPVLTDEAKAKAAEAAAKTAHGNKMADFQLCKSREATAAHYFKSAKAAGKETKPPTDTPACIDPGAFVFPVPDPAAVAASPAAPVAQAAGQPAAAATAQVAAKTAAKPGAPVKK